jgi:phosphate/sulfate permease
MKMYKGTNETSTTMGTLTGYGRVSACAIVLHVLGMVSGALVEGVAVTTAISRMVGAGVDILRVIVPDRYLVSVQLVKA